MDIVGRNIQLLIDYLGYEYQYQFADHLKINRSIISYLVNCKRNPSIEILFIIKREYPGLNLNWLMYNQGTMIMEGYNKKFKPIASGAKKGQLRPAKTAEPQ
jgi:hypothetical protein